MKKYDVPSGEMAGILEGHNIKAYSTLKWLMRQIGFDYFYERILFRYQQSEQEQNSKNINSPATIHNVIKVMVRGLQMYETIDQILLIFSLLAKAERGMDGQQFKGRILSVVQQVLSNNKFMQKRFIFQGTDLVTSLALAL